jgi:hypothetical protein
MGIENVKQNIIESTAGATANTGAADEEDDLPF